MAIPREFSKEIKAESDQAFGWIKNWKFNDKFDEHLGLQGDYASMNLKVYWKAPHF